ncbi:DUF3560 domain-containing protein [Streptomyces sp. NPDC017260]|uniref:DUF3560 domain-containing protein n=1 Tax=unclassified Streptomyces TaxID=2593676 RepID=UPI0037A1F34E
MTTTPALPMPVAEALAEGAPRNLGALAGSATDRGWGAMVERDGDVWTLVIATPQDSRTERYTWRAGKWSTSNPRGYRAALNFYRAEADGAPRATVADAAPVETVECGECADGSCVDCAAEAADRKGAEEFRVKATKAHTRMYDGLKKVKAAHKRGNAAQERAEAAAERASAAAAAEDERLSARVAYADALVWSLPHGSAERRAAFGEWLAARWDVSEGPAAEACAEADEYLSRVQASASEGWADDERAGWEDALERAEHAYKEMMIEYGTFEREEPRGVIVLPSLFEAETAWEIIRAYSRDLTALVRHAEAAADAAEADAKQVEAWADAAEAAEGDDAADALTLFTLGAPDARQEELARAHYGVSDRVAEAWAADAAPVAPVAPVAEAAEAAPVAPQSAAETPAESTPRTRARTAPSVADVECARRAAEEWPEAMEARSLNDRYEGEFRRSDLLSELSVCGERFPFRFHFESGGGHTVTLPTGDVRGTWGEVTGSAIAYVIAERPASVLRATAETARVYGIYAERAAERAEEHARTAVLVGMARAALDTVREFAQRIDWDGLTDEQYGSARGAVREAEQWAERAESAYGRGDVDTARWAARDTLAVARWFGLAAPSAQECAERAPEPRAVAGRARPEASAFLLRITRPGWEGPAGKVEVPTGGAPAGSGVTPDVPAEAEEAETAPEPAHSGELDADTSKGDATPGGEGGFSRELDANASKEAAPEGAGAATERAPVAAVPRVVRRADKMREAEAAADAAEAAAGVLAELSAEAARVADCAPVGDVRAVAAAEAADARWYRMDRQAWHARYVADRLRTEDEQARADVERARTAAARLLSGEVPAGRGAWLSADGGAVVTFPLSWESDDNPAADKDGAFVAVLADAVAARDAGRTLKATDVPSKAKTGRGPGAEFRAAVATSGRPLVDLWKAPRIPAEGKPLGAETLSAWDMAGDVISETEAAPGVWLPMAAVQLAETACGNGWTVAMQRENDGRTVIVRAAGTAERRGEPVAYELSAVWVDGAWCEGRSGVWVNGGRHRGGAPLWRPKERGRQAPSILGTLAHAAEAGALAPAAPPAGVVSAPAPSGVSDPGTAEAWDGEGGAAPGVVAPRPVAQSRGLDADTSGGGVAPAVGTAPDGDTPAPVAAGAAEGEAEAADIVIRHTHEDGTTVEGSAKGDGVWEALRALGWTYRRNPGIFIRGSRYKGADRWKINRAADAVRALGLSCAVVIEEGMSFAEREAARVDAAEERAERYADRSGRAAASSQSARDASDRIGERFWMGQPILVGHHSEGRARRDQERMNNAMRKSIAEGERAGYWASRAAAAEAYERYRKNPGRTLRRIEKLEAERRGVLRERDGVDDKGRAADVWRREPSEARREELTCRLAEYDEELTYWAETIKEAERRGFKVWGRADFVKGDFARWRGSWYEVTRVNAKTVTVPHIHAAFDGGAVGAVDGCRVVTRAATAETRHKGSTYTLPYNEVSGRMSAEQMRAALAGEPVPADPRDVTPEAAEVERAAERQDQAAPASVAPPAPVSAPAPAGVSDPGTAAAWEGDGGAVPGVAVPRPGAQSRELDASTSKSDATPGGEGGFSRGLDADASTGLAGGAAEGAPVAPVPQDGAALRDALIAAHGNEDAMRAADWWCDSHCATCADGRECADCETCTAFAAPWPARWARRRGKGAPERQVHICHGPGGMSEGQRLALGGDDSADVDAVGIEIEADAAATARAAGYTIIHADVRTVDPRHPVLTTVERLHFSTPCPTISRGGKGSGVKPAEVERFMDVMFHAAEWLGHIEVEDVCQDYGGPHDYDPQQGGDESGEAAWDPDTYEGSWQMVCGTHDEDTDECGDDCTQWIETQHCMSGRAAAVGTPDEFRAAALEACADQRTALMAEVILWPMVMLKGGGALQSVTMEQSDNLMKSAAPLCAAIETELRESLEFDWVSFQVECASRYGAASRRSRTWMVAVRDGEPAGAVCTANRDEVHAYEAGLWGGRKDKIPATRPDMAYRVDFLGGRQPLPALTVAQALGWDSGLVVDTRGVRSLDPRTGRPKGGGSFSADVVSQCVTATWYGATLRRADEAQGCASLGKAFTQQQLALLVGFRWDYPWQHVGRGVGIRNMAQMAADAVSPFMGMAVTGATVKRARRVWYRRALAYQRALYAYAEQLWTDEQRALVADHLRPGDVQAQAGVRGFPRAQVPPMLPAPPVRLMLERGPVRLELPPAAPGRAVRESSERGNGRAGRTVAARPVGRRLPVAVPVRAMRATAPGAGGAVPREPRSAAAAAPVGGPLSGPAETRGNGGVHAGHSTRQGATRQGTRQGTRQLSEGAERALPTGGPGRTLPRGGGRAPPSSARPRAGRDLPALPET